MCDTFFIGEVTEEVSLLNEQEAANEEMYVNLEPLGQAPGIHIVF